MIHRFRACVAVVFLVCAVSAAAVGKLELPPQQMIILPTDMPTASGMISVRNSGDAAAKTNLLKVGTFFGAPGKELLPIKAEIKEPPAEIAAGATVSIRLEFSNFADFGYASAELRDGPALAGMVRVKKKLFSFNVAPSGYDGKVPLPVHMIYGRPTSIPLTNTDNFTHSIDWWLREGSRDVAYGRVPLLRPGSTVYLDIPYERAGFVKWLEGTLLAAPQNAATLVLHSVPGAPPGTEISDKQIPLQLRRTAGDGAKRDLAQLGLILLMLFLGGVTSLYLTYWVPNALKKIDVKKQIEELTEKIHQLRRTSSTLRVLLSVERNQLRARLDSRKIFNLDFAVLAADCEQRVKALERRIALAQRIEHLHMDIEREWERGTTIGPTTLRWALGRLHESAARLEQAMSEEDVRFVEGQIQLAADSLQPAGLDTALVAQVVNAAVKLQGLPSNEIKTLVDEVPELQPALDVTAATPPTSTTDFWKLDYAVAKMQVAARVPAAERVSLLKYLKLHALDAFGEAQLQARLIQEGSTTADELKKALTAGRVQTSFAPEKPEVNCLVTFELKVLDPALSSSTAKRTYTCTWEFGDGFHEQGWRVSHYFTRSGSFGVKAIIKDRAGAEVSTQSVSVTVLRKKDKFIGARTEIELIRLGVTLLLALLMMVAGAKDKLANLSLVAALVALFLIGAGAEQIKNLLAPRPDK